MTIKGFSLIELMITVAIIGILTLMAAPVYNGYVARVEITNIKNVAMNIGSLVNLGYITGEMESHDYTYDNLLKIAPNVNAKNLADHCMNDEYSMYDRMQIKQVILRRSRFFTHKIIINLQ